MEEKKDSQNLLGIPVIPEDLKKMVSQLEDTVRMVVDAEKGELKPNVSFVDVMKELLLIQKAIEAMASEQQEMAKFFDSLKERYGNIPSPEKLLVKEDLAVLDRVKKLTSVCEGARARLHEEIGRNPKLVAESNASLDEALASSKRKKTKRKRKFRAFGNEKDGWIKS